MKLLIVILLFPLFLQGQNIVLSGAIEQPGVKNNSDTTKITVFSDGKVILTTKVVEPVYSVILTDEPCYQVVYEWRGTVKRNTIFTHDMGAEAIRRDCDFAIKSNVIMMKEPSPQGLWKWFRKQGNITEFYYGYHADRRDF